MTTESMKPYPAYKDSGIEWMGEIPEGWKVKKLKWLADAKLSNIDKKSKDDELTVKLCNYVDVYYNDNITPNIKFMVATARKDQIDALSLEKDDVLLTKDSESPDDIAVPAFVPESLSGIVCGYHLTRIRPNEDAHGNYLFRSFLSTGIRDQFEMNANGITRFGIGKYTIDNSLFLVPPLHEQQSIATFLDNQTVKIDTLIENKQKQIKLLKEERTAIINQAVTKGLNPDVPMRDSGIEWLGEIPEHWGLKKFNYLAKDINVGFVGTIEKYYTEADDGILLLKTGNIGDNKLVLDEMSYVTKAFHQSNIKSQLSSGDIIIARHGESGKAAVIPNEISEANCLNIVVLRKSKLMHGDYYSFVLNSSKYQQYLKSSQGGSVQGVINTSDIINLKVLYPSLSEQQSIVTFLNHQTAKIDTDIEKIQQQITLLQEYRAALISEAVTGKIDLRNQHEIPTPK